MRSEKLNAKSQDTPPGTTVPPQEVRREARRRLIKAGLMSVPVIMTVHSRPLFAQTNGSVGALGYGGYETTTQSDIIFQDQAPTTTSGYTDPYGDNSDQSGDYSFKRSRDPRSDYRD